MEAIFAVESNDDGLVDVIHELREELKDKVVSVPMAGLQHAHYFLPRIIKYYNDRYFKRKLSRLSAHKRFTYSPLKLPICAGCEAGGGWT